MWMTSLKSRFQTTPFSIAIRDRWLIRWSVIVVYEDCFGLVQVQKMTVLSWAIRCQKRQIDPQSSVNVWEWLSDTWCGSNAVGLQAKLKVNFLIALLETTAAAGEAAKLHKFIRQIDDRVPDLPAMLQPGGCHFRGSTLESDQRFHAKTQTNFAPQGIGIQSFLDCTRRSASAASALSDHRVWLRDFTVGLNMTETKIFQRCADALKIARRLWVLNKIENVVASDWANDQSMERSVP